MHAPWGDIHSIATDAATTANAHARAFTDAGETQIANMWLIWARQALFVREISKAMIAHNRRPLKAPSDGDSNG